MVSVSENSRYPPRFAVRLRRPRSRERIAVNHPVLGVPAATRCPYSARSRTSTGQALLSTRSQLAWARSEESATLEVAPGPLTGGCWKMANSATAVASRDLVDRLEQER